MNGNLKMSNNHYSDNELHLMSYQDLRRLSILLQLPANIKKEHMISMIQAHQDGDNGMKTAIANKIMEERKAKRLSKKKQLKSGVLNSSVNTQQIPTDLSVSTQHEFETRFSYVAHYSKDELSSGVARIIKQEAEVSRRNRRVLQQSRKPTRKLSTVGRTEIMLPRNHSLTTPVRLMPQYERGFSSQGDYEPMSGIPNAKTHFQDLNYNYHFQEEYSNSLISTTSQDLYRSEPYWHTREVYNNSLMPILSSLLTSNPATLNSSSYHAPTNSVRGPSSFQQGVYENYIKCNSITGSEAFQSSATNASPFIVNSHHMFNNGSSTTGNTNRRYCLYAKNEFDFEVPARNEINCQHCNKREELCHENQELVDFYTARNSDVAEAHREVELPQYFKPCCRTERKDLPTTVPLRAFESSCVIAHKTSEIVETDVSDREMRAPMIDDYESTYPEEDKIWEESENRNKKLIERISSEKENLVEDFLPPQSQESLISEISDSSINLEPELPEEKEKKTECYAQSLNKCGYVSGHNKYPETISSCGNSTSLPSFLSAFCSNEFHNKTYSVCRNSSTGTTETHLNPIMSSAHAYASQFANTLNPQTQAISPVSGGQIQRQWYYTYPESQVPFSLDTTWNEYPNELENKIIAQSNGHNVQVVKCRTHGCHYLYSITGPCDQRCA